jgi:hypothetical protein
MPGLGKHRDRAYNPGIEKKSGPEMTSTSLILIQNWAYMLEFLSLELIESISKEHNVHVMQNVSPVMEPSSFQIFCMNPVSTTEGFL